MIEINLVPDVKQELIKSQQVRSKVIGWSITVSLVSAAIVALLAIYVFTVQTVRSSLADSAIAEGGAKLDEVQDLSKTLTIQNQLTKITALNDDKKIDSRIFDVLGAIIPSEPNDVKISNLTVDAAQSKRTITIEGQARNSYAAVEVFKKMISGAKFKYDDVSGTKQELFLASNISTSDTSYGEDASGVKVLRFTLDFVYAPELFSPLSKNVTISISNNGNATDSYLGVPNSIFVDKAKDLPGEP